MKIRTRIELFRFLFLMITFLVLTGLAYCYSCLRSITWAESAAVSLSDAQAMVKEVVDAYGSKGVLIQYESGGRRNQYTTPEDITKYNTIHLPCSGFDFAVYYESFGIMIPTKSKDADKYAGKFATVEMNDGYGGKTGDADHQDLIYHVALPTDADRMTELFDYLVDEDILQVGDAVIWFKDGEDAEGHDVIVYNVNKSAAESKKVGVYQAGGAVGLASSSANIAEKLTNADMKLTIAYNDGQAGVKDINSNNVIGSLYETSLYDRMIRDKDANYRLTIYRPLAYISQGKYNKYDSSSESSAIVNISEEKLGSSKMRRNFPGIRIEKEVTSNKGAVQNSVVGPGEELTYTITIKNTSSQAYNGLRIVENIPTSLVKEENDRQQVIQDVASIAAGGTYEFSYNVSVLSTESLIGEEIVASGYVMDTNGGSEERIATTTIKNTIGTNLSDEQQTSLMTAYNSLKNTYQGTELIDKIYKQAFDFDLDTSDLVIGGFYDPTSRTQTQNEACNSYTLQSKDTGAIEAGYSLIKNYRRYSYSSSGAPGVELDSANSMYDLVLNGYYNGLSYYYVTEYCSNTRISAYQSFDETDLSKVKKTDRKDRVYEDTLQVGDVLLYSNRPFTELQDMNYNVNENGVYAFIWDGENFVGNNSDKTKARNVIYGTNDLTASYRHNDDFTKNDLQHLFGKDYFVVLRPALAMGSQSGEDPDDPDPIDPDDPATVEFTLSFDANQGTDAPASVSCETNSDSCTVTIPNETPERNGYDFLGWAESSSAATPDYNKNDSVTLSSNKVLHAVWEQKSEPVDPDDPDPVDPDDPTPVDPDDPTPVDPDDPTPVDPDDPTPVDPDDPTPVDPDDPNPVVPDEPDKPDDSDDKKEDKNDSDTSDEDKKEISPITPNTGGSGDGGKNVGNVLPLAPIALTIISVTILYYKRKRDHRKFY